ncbi:nicotinate-nucleotide--dimethylbenzimidazole phosphoribosyltransferase, partial [Rhodoplanes roseus]
MTFPTLDDLRAACRDLPAGDEAAAAAALARQAVLTKPPGSLGRLEDLAVWLARWQGRPIPKLDRVSIVVFAGNHGVAARGVSAFPIDVTAQMVANYAAGGAGINRLAETAGATLRVVPLELDRPTADFTKAPAMETADFLAAVSAGYEAVSPDDDLFAVGEMGIGNTTAAAALCAALLGGGATRWVGRGTGVDEHGLARKRDAVEAGLVRHAKLVGDEDRVAAVEGVGEQQDA